MNPFQRARDQANEVRKILSPDRCSTDLIAKELLSFVESQVDIGIEPVDKNYPDLGGGSAVLHRDQRFIYVSNEVQEWGEDFCALVAHELGHWYLDSEKEPLKVSNLANFFSSDGPPAVLTVEAYGAREREELQANVFARELLLPRHIARDLALSGEGPASVARRLGIPLEFARLQMLDALLLPDIEFRQAKLNEPSDDQLAAASSSARAANVVAGPGTGKTTTLLHRVKWLVNEKKVDPSRIVVLTFTNKSAFELVERLRCAGIDRAADVWAGTFHAFGLELVRKYHQYFGLSADINVSDDFAALMMLASGLPRLNLSYYLRVDDPFDWLVPVVKGITRLKEESVRPETYRAYISSNPVEDSDIQRRREDLATLYEAYEELLSEKKSMDFVDLIYKPASMMKSDRGLFSDFVDRFEHILVDEYQDVTQVMVEFLRQLAMGSKSVWVVGDIRQAIHHWRGASLKSLMKFDAEFKAHARGGSIQRYSLSINRRSNQEILDLIHEVGRQHKLESSMPLDDMVSERGYSGELPRVVTCSKRTDVSRSIADNIETLRASGVEYGRQAVLCRRSGDIKVIADYLLERAIPIVHIGDLYQRPEVKAIVCLMQLLVEREPKSLVGLKDFDGLDMPLPDIQALICRARSDIGYQRGRWLKYDNEDISDAGKAVVERLRSLIGRFSHASNPWDFVCAVLLEMGFFLPRAGDESVSAWVTRISLWQFAYSVRNGNGDMAEARLSRYLFRQRLKQRLGGASIGRELPPEASALDGVRILTVHGSKGLEFDAVHVAYADARSYGAQAPEWTPPESILDIVPPEVLGSSQAEFALEEAVERNNLLYVAVSRAKSHLFIYQDTEYGDKDLPPQLLHYPQKFAPVSVSHSRSQGPRAVTESSFSSVDNLPFSSFQKYVMCPLQYWYSEVVELKAEADIDVSIRARMAVMDALRKISSGDQRSSEEVLADEWSISDLPNECEDPSLWRDANIAFSRGIKVVRSIIDEGGGYSEPVSVVGGVSIQMPWGFLVKTRYSTEFTVIRFSARRSQEIITILRPMVNGLLLQGTKKMTIRYLLSGKVDDVPGSKKPESTKSFKAAVGISSGHNLPAMGRHCNRCAYFSICPAAPTH